MSGSPDRDPEPLPVRVYRNDRLVATFRPGAPMAFILSRPEVQGEHAGCASLLYLQQRCVSDPAYAVKWDAESGAIPGGEYDIIIIEPVKPSSPSPSPSGTRYKRTFDEQDASALSVKKQKYDDDGSNHSTFSRFDEWMIDFEDDRRLKRCRPWWKQIDCLNLPEFQPILNSKSPNSTWPGRHGHDPDPPNSSFRKYVFDQLTLLPKRFTMIADGDDDDEREFNKLTIFESDSSFNSPSYDHNAPLEPYLTLTPPNRNKVFVHTIVSIGDVRTYNRRSGRNEFERDDILRFYWLMYRIIRQPQQDRHRKGESTRRNIIRVCAYGLALGGHAWKSFKSYVTGFLTDGRFFQFFRILPNDNDSESNEGSWSYWDSILLDVEIDEEKNKILSFFYNTPKELDLELFDILHDGIEYIPEYRLGYGGTGTVWSINLPNSNTNRNQDDEENQSIVPAGTTAAAAAAVKVATSERMYETLKNEAKILSDAIEGGVPFIPKLLWYETGLLCIQPVGKPLQPDEWRRKHVLQLLDYAVAMHKIGLVDRDIRPPNIIQSGDSLLKIDLGAVVRISEVPLTYHAYHGSIHFAADELLYELQKNKDACFMARNDPRDPFYRSGKLPELRLRSLPQHALHSIVRTVFAIRIFGKRMKDVFGELDQRDYYVIQRYWSKQFARRPQWLEWSNAAENQDIEKLKMMAELFQ